MSRDALYLCDSCRICRNGIELEILTMPVCPGRCDLCGRSGERSAVCIYRDDSLAHCPQKAPSIVALINGPDNPVTEEEAWKDRRYSGIRFYKATYQEPKGDDQC